MELLEVGRIGRAHGLAGEVYVDLVTTRTDRLAPGTRLIARRGADGGETELVVERSRPQQTRFLVSFVDVVDRTGAERLRNVALLAEPAEADPDAPFVHELIGAEVVDVAGVARGAIVSVEANPASDLLVLESGALVPMRFVVSFADGLVTVDVPDGLFE